MSGRVVAAADPLARASEAPVPEGQASISTARWSGAGIRFERHHLARLERDAATLGIGRVDRDEARRAFRELGRAAFAEDEGVLRIEARRASRGTVQLLGTPRPVGPERRAWRAITLPICHDGPTAFGGAKLASRALYARARAVRDEAGVDEALLFDARGRLVEGTRTNLVAVGDDGIAFAPPDARGAVAGVALAVACEADPSLARRDVARAAVANLRELIALNAVRGAVPIVELDGRPVGDGEPGPQAARLAALLEAAP